MLSWLREEEEDEGAPLPPPDALMEPEEKGGERARRKRKRARASAAAPPAGSPKAEAKGSVGGGVGEEEEEWGGDGVSSRFGLINQKFDQQYASVYYSRLLRLRPNVQAAAAAAWVDGGGGGEGGPRLVDRISALEAGCEAVVVGTLYKVMKLKPSILDEYKKKSTAAALEKERAVATRARLVSPSDSLVLEDDSGRVQLQLSPAAAARFPVSYFVSGVVVAVRGHEDAQGQFYVDDFVLPGLAPQPAPRARAPGPGPRYVAVVSGIRTGDPAADPLAAQLLVDFLTGAAGGAADQAAAARVVRVLVAGDSLHEQPVEEDAKYKKRKSGVDRLASPLRRLDALLAELAASVPVDVMPGRSDPATYQMPQQPLHPCLFPAASTNPGVRLLTNPATVRHAGGVVVSATSGQPQADMARLSAAAEPAELIERSLRWRHMAPSAPDTLACYPFEGRDPFVIDESPHVMVAGSQAAFGTRLVEEGEGDERRRVRVVAVPAFAAAQSFALVDIASENLDCHEVHISTPAFERRAAERRAAAASRSDGGANDDDDDEEVEDDDEIPEPDGDGGEGGGGEE